VGLERSPLSLVSTIEELLERKSSGSGLESREYGRRDPSLWPRGALYPQTLALTSPTSGGRSVGIVRSRTQATEFAVLFGSERVWNLVSDIKGGTDWGCLRTGCWGGYLDQRGMRWREEWRKLHNKELRNLYCSPSIIRMIRSGRMRWAGYVAGMGRKWMHVGYWWKSQNEKKKTLGRSRHWWVDNIKIYPREIG
jgi:hypothetical protein